MTGWSPRTRAVTAGRTRAEGEPLNPPIVLASNLLGTEGAYARTHGTATWTALEEAIGELEGGAAVAYASGMAACAAVVWALAPRAVVLPAASYLGVRALLGDAADHQGVELRHVDVTDTLAVAAAARGADVVWVETPTNPTLDVADVPAIVAAAHEAGARVVVDSTFASPLRARPLEAGADVVVHSATKLIAGHSDALLGVAVTRDHGVHERLIAARTFQGGTPGALEAYLALRGLRTLPLRLEAGERSARTLVERLVGHPAVEQVRYPGEGTMVSFVVRGGAAAADAVCDAVQLAVPATSLGGVETTIERRQKYAGDAHVAPGLLRMSVGVEDVDDLWADLASALDTANQTGRTG